MMNIVQEKDKRDNFIDYNKKPNATGFNKQL